MLKKFRNFTCQHAIPAAFILAIIFFWLVIGINTLVSYLPDTLFVNYANAIIAMLYPIGITILFGFKDTLRFNTKSFFKGLLLGLPFVILQMFALVNFFVETAKNPDAVWKPWYLIILGVISVLKIAVREEFFYRAIIQNLLAKKYAHSIKGIWITAIVSAIVFGSIHAFNVLAGMDPKAVIVQVLTNICIGLFDAALYLRSKNIWALVAIHTLTDMAGLAESQFLMNTSDIAVMSSLTWHSMIAGLIFAGLAIFLLRPSKCKEIIAPINAKSEVQANATAAK